MTDKQYNPKWRTRIDELGAGAARFYFSDRDDAVCFAHTFDAQVSESSPPTAGGGIWCVVVPYEAKGGAQALPLTEFMSEAIALGRAARKSAWGRHENVDQQIRAKLGHHPRGRQPL